MALVTNAVLTVGSIRAGTASRVGFAPLNTVSTNTTDVISTDTGSGGFRLAQLVYARQDGPTTQSIQCHESYAQAYHPSGTVVGVYAAIGNAENAGAGLVSDMRGGTFGAGLSGAGNVTTATCIYAQSAFRTGAGVIAKAVGVRVGAQTVGTVNYAIETEGTASVKLGGDLEMGADRWVRGNLNPLIRFASSRTEISANNQPLHLSSALTTVNCTAGGGQVLPSQPATYLRVRVNSTDYVVPLFNVP